MKNTSLPIYPFNDDGHYATNFFRSLARQEQVTIWISWKYHETSLFFFFFTKQHNFFSAAHG